MRRSLRNVMGLALLLALVLSPLAVQAATSSYGANYGYDDNVSATQGHMVVCDSESDGDPAYSIFDTLQSGTDLRVGDNGEGCGHRYVLSRVTYHYTCEDHAFSPDPCGGGVYANT